MKRVLLIVGLCSLLGCPLQTSSSSTMPSTGGGAANNGGGDGGGGGNVMVPDVVGKTQSEAEAAISSAGLRGGIRVGNDPGSYDIASAKICTQTPGSGQQSASSLFVSVRFCTVEKAYVDNEGDVTGMTVAAAQKAIKDKGFTGTVEVSELYEFDKDCKDGTVCRFDPRRWYLDPQRRMTLYVNRKLSISAPE